MGSNLKTEGARLSKMRYTWIALLILIGFVFTFFAGTYFANAKTENRFRINLTESVPYYIDDYLWPEKRIKEYETINVIQNRVTGCRYISNTGKRSVGNNSAVGWGGIVPLYKSDGKTVDCSK